MIHMPRKMSKRTRSSSFASKTKKGTKRQKNRKGYSSVARTRGAAVTGEMKYFDTEKDGTALPASNEWTGTEFDLTANSLFTPVVGAGVNQRIGKEAKVLKIRINGLIVAPSQADQVAADSSSLCRVMLVQDTQTNAAQMQGENLMTSGTTDTIGINTFQNIDNFGRFRVLGDKFISLQNPNMSYDGTNVEQAGLIKRFKFVYKFKNPVKVRFNNTNGGTIADIVDNSFHIIANSHNISLAPQISYYSRFYYKE